MAEMPYMRIRGACEHNLKNRTIPGKYDKIEGLEQLDKVINIDQSLIGRTPLQMLPPILDCLI